MSDLMIFRNHCRQMAKECAKAEAAKKAGDFADASTLWQMLADEVDAYLAGDPDVVRVPQPDDEPFAFEELA